jgi:MSHA biogenesis protein MshN
MAVHTMSLINQVLKDLEKRHASVDAVPLARSVRPLPEERARRGRWVVLAALPIGVVIAAAWWWNMRNPPTATATPGNVPQAAAIAGSQPQALVNPAQSSSLGEPKHAASGPAVTAAPQPADAAAQRAEANMKSAPLAIAASIAAQALRPPVAGAVKADPPGVVERASLPSNRVAIRAPSPPASPLKAKVSASVESVQYADSKPAAEELNANIDKQVRAPSARDRAEASFRQGMNAMHAGNMAEAEVALREALRFDPMADKARQALLGMLVEAARREEAERLLDERLQLDAGNYVFATALARLQLERGANADALATLQRSASHGENSAEYQAMLANALSRVGQHKDAGERFGAAARLAPRNALWYMGLGVELRTENRNPEARAAFQRARELGGLNPQLVSYLDQQLHELE